MREEIPRHIHRRWHRDTRYYEARVEQDLWGDWVLTRVWGRRGTPAGQVRHDPCSSYIEALERLDAVTRRRAAHGYALIWG